MYCCSTQSCPNGENKKHGGGTAVSNLSREKPSFVPLYLLKCGHSICDGCIFNAVKDNVSRIRCSQCKSQTTISDETVQAVSEVITEQLNQSQSSILGASKESKIVTISSNDVPIDRFAFGSAVDAGAIQVSEAVEIIDIDLDGHQVSVKSAPVKSKSQYDQDYTYISHVSKEIEKFSKPEFTTVFNEGFRVFSACHDGIATLGKLQKEATSNSIKLKEKAKANFHNLHSLLQIQEVDLMRKIDGWENEHNKNTRSIEKELEAQMKSLKASLFPCRSIKSNQAQDEKGKEINDLLRQPYELEIRDGPTKQLIVQFSNDMTGQIKNYFKIVRRDEAPYNLKGSINTFYTPTTSQVADDNENETVVAEKANEIEEMVVDTSNNINGRIESPEIVEVIAPIPVKMSQPTVDTVMVTNVVNPFEFYVRSCSSNQQMDEIEKELVKIGTNTFFSPPALGSIQIGANIIYYSHIYKRWCRARLRWYGEANTNKHLGSMISRQIECEVFGIDTGAVERVNYYNIRAAGNSLFNVDVWPPFCMKCSLFHVTPREGGITWSNSAIQVFTSFTDGKKMKMMTAKIERGVNYVDLAGSAGLSSVAEGLVYMDVARFSVNDRSGLRTRFTTEPIRTYSQMEKLNIGESISVRVVNVTSPDKFFVNASRNQEKILQLQTMLEVYSSLADSDYTFYSPQISSPCVAQFSLDNKFYRAIIKNADPTTRKVHVEYIDFGNEELVDVSKIRIIRDEFLELPAQAILCKLIDVEPLAHFTWSDNANEHFKYLVEGDGAGSQTQHMCVYQYDSDGRAACVVLHRFDGVRSININVTLVEELYAKSSGILSQSIEPEHQGRADERLRNDDINYNTANISVNVYDILKEIRERQLKANLGKKDSLIPVAVTYVESPTSFWVQLSQPEVFCYYVAFETRMHAELQNSVADSGVDGQFELDEQCVFYVEKDQEYYWRRGFISEIIEPETDSTRDSIKYKVFSCDYGRTFVRKRSEMRKVEANSKYFKDQPYAIKCHLPYLTPTGCPKDGGWTKAATEMFISKLVQCKNSLFILVKDQLTDEQPESVAVNVVGKQSIIRGATDPQETIYHSMIDILKQHGLAMDSNKRDRVCIDDEADLNRHNLPPQVIVKTEMPFSYANDSTLSKLRHMHNRNNMEQNRVEAYKEAELPISNYFQVICTEVDSEMNVYFRLWDTKDTQPMQIVNKTISDVLSEKDSLPAFSGDIKRGTPCSAYFKFDKTWNRAEVIGVVRDSKKDTSLINVQFVDYGNVETVFIESISSEVFNCDIPKLALRAKLFNLKAFSREVEEKLKEELHTLLVDKVCSVNWENSPEPQMKVSITLPDDQPLKMVLLNKDLVKEIKVTDDEYPREMKQLTEFLNSCPYPANELTFDLNEFYPVEISHFVMNNYIFIQSLKIDDIYDTGVSQINEQHNNFLFEQDKMRETINFQRRISLDEIRPGLAVAAQFDDDNWYRAVITEVKDDGKCEVLFVDYGNTSVLNNEQLREMKRCYIKHPSMYAILCKLTNIKPKSFRWPRDMVSKLSDIFARPPKKMHLIAKLKRISPSIPHEVDLYWAGITAPRAPVEYALQSLVENNIIDLVNPNLAVEEIVREKAKRKGQPLGHQESPGTSFQPPFIPIASPPQVKEERTTTRYFNDRNV